MDSKLALYTLGIWLLLMIIAILNGAFREAFLRDSLGEYPGHVVSTLMLSGVALLTIYLFLRTTTIDYAQSDLIVMGSMWFCMTIVFEFLFGYYIADISLGELLDNYDVLEGRVWVLVPISVLVGPVLMDRLANG